MDWRIWKKQENKSEKDEMHNTEKMAESIRKKMEEQCDRIRKVREDEIFINMATLNDIIRKYNIYGEEQEMLLKMIAELHSTIHKQAIKIIFFRERVERYESLIFNLAHYITLRDPSLGQEIEPLLKDIKEQSKKWRQ